MKPNPWWIVPGVIVVAAVILAVVATNTTSGSPKAAAASSVAPPPTLSADPIPNRTPASSTSLSTPSSTVSSTAVTPSESAPVASSTHVDIPVGDLPEGQVSHEMVKGLGRVSIYKIAPGDTLWSIGHTFGLDGEVLTLYQWNRSVIGRNPDLIHPGTVVIVDPSGKVSTV